MNKVDFLETRQSVYDSLLIYVPPAGAMIRVRVNNALYLSFSRGEPSLLDRIFWGYTFYKMILEEDDVYTQ